MRIRRFHRSDLGAVLGIERDCFGRDAFPADLFLELAECCPALFLVAVAGEAGVCGYAVGCVHPERSASAAEVVSIGVHSSARGCGIGRRLLARLLEGLRRDPRATARVSLTVRTENAVARRLYEQFGFTRSRLVRGYYRDGGDGVRMHLDLAR